MKTIYDAVQRFCAKHPRFGIRNLMRYIIIGTAAVYLLLMFSNSSAISFLAFDYKKFIHGEIWRAVTYVFYPAYSSPFSMIISLYFYYWVGSTLEKQWGSTKFTLYYVGGVLLTVIGAVITGLITNRDIVLYGATYINLSMFLAFACLFPNTKVLLFFFIPIKMKWLAYLDGGLFLLDMISSLVQGDLSGVIVPLLALLNFAIFIYPELKYKTDQTRARYRPESIKFRQAVQQQQQEKGYHHKCSVCGKTDTDYPNLEFRYCSKCVGYHCFCQDHIFTHVHFEEP